MFTINLAQELNHFHLWIHSTNPLFQVINQLQLNFSHVPRVAMLKLEFKHTKKCLDTGNADSGVEKVTYNEHHRGHRSLGKKLCRGVLSPIYSVGTSTLLHHHCYDSKQNCHATVALNHGSCYMSHNEKPTLIPSGTGCVYPRQGSGGAFLKEKDSLRHRSQICKTY